VTLARERFALLAAIAAVAALGWIYLGRHAGMMTAMESSPRDGADFAMIVAMWVVMMAAMMLPSVIPAVLVHSAVSRQLTKGNEARWRPAAFVAGYGLAWGTFSVAAAGIQVWLERLALLSPSLATASPMIGGLVVAGAGIYQVTPAKEVCLRHCRAPLEFVAERWRAGISGALQMGVRHGAYCVGCCGLLMALLFVVGVMNLVWVAAIAVFVLLEKVAFAGTHAGRLTSGCTLIFAGLALANS
jgi:predicted metal-binding membrane protein